MSVTNSPLISIKDLSVTFPTVVGDRQAVSHVDLDIRQGEILGIVGESGSGKSTLAFSLLNQVSKPGKISGGEVNFEDKGNVLSWSGEKLRKYRGGSVGYVFQASQNSMNPLERIGKQLLDLGRSHDVKDLRGLLREAKELCDRMGLDGARVLESYQHELSGGMRQRVGIVFALVLSAKVLVLDEPTTALDMLSQTAVMQIVKQIHAERDLATIMITHDIGVVAEMADRMAVMYGGRLVEIGETRRIVRQPEHPYTAALLRAIPRIDGDPGLARPLGGRPPDLSTAPTKGCVFAPRCPFVQPSCREDEPQLEELNGRLVACPVVANDSTLAPSGVANHVEERVAGKDREVAADDSAAAAHPITDTEQDDDPTPEACDV